MNQKWIPKTGGVDERVLHRKGKEKNVGNFAYTMQNLVCSLSASNF